MSELHDEVEFTPWAEPGWSSWNGQSPEAEVCDFFAMLVRMMKPALVIETGVGQGYMTRAILPVLGDGVLRCYESDDEWRNQIASWDIWSSTVSLAANPTPGDDMLASADLCFLDSEFSTRMAEIELWGMIDNHGSVALIHDTGERHDEGTHHSMIRDLIAELGMTGVFLHNPRGSFLAFKP